MRYVYLILLTTALLTSCSIATPNSDESTIQYFVHTIQPSESSYVSGSPYGHYVIRVFDERIGPEYWNDVWAVAMDGSIYRPVPSLDSTTSVWYNIIYLDNGSFAFRNIFSQIGMDYVIFFAPATSLGQQNFIAEDFWASISR